MTHWRNLLTQAKEVLAAGRTHEALQLCDRAAIESEDARYGAALIRGAIHLEMGDAAAALSAYQAVADAGKPDADLDCARGLAYFELAEIPEAEAAIRSALRIDSHLAEGHYTLGLILELKGRREANTHFRRARELSPAQYPEDRSRTREEFEALLNRAASTLPEHVIEHIRKFPIVVADLPVLDELQKIQPRMSPQSLALVLGSSEGRAVQPCLLIFKRNVERAFRDEELIEAGIRLAVIREFTRALGLKDS
jgi:tetratricopeptide (TPR) repeat protein